MRNHPDAVRVGEAIKTCFAAISRCEQDLHAIHRAEIAVTAIPSRGSRAAPNRDSESADDLLKALEIDHVLIDAEIDKILITDDCFLDAPEMSAAEILHELDQVAKPILPYSLDIQAIARSLAPLIIRAQLIDSWLEPAFNTMMKLNAAQAEFRDAFDFEGHLRLDDGALLLPRRRQSWRADDDETGDCLGLFARHLRNLAYIPYRLDCDDPDELTSSGKPILADYCLWASSILQAKPMPKDPVIAVAPLAERGSEVSFVPSACRSKYALRLAYDENRFAETLARALDQGVHILLIPEMALPEGNPATFDERMRRIFLEVKVDHFTRTNQASQLRLVIAGVLGGIRADGFHRNYAVAFDADGDQPDGFRQLKLSHWNLTRIEQDRFGITHHQAIHGSLADPVYENSLPAERLTVLEIPGVGRAATLICADMSQNNPGDWLSINAVLDWLYAPIMDKSTCWEIADKMHTPRPWIVRRSYRSARLTGTLVITTNSMALSRWINEANRLAGSTWPPYEKVGIGLAIDGRSDPPGHDHLSVLVDGRNVLEQFARPVKDWKPFPTPR